jgi:hypothetical protein
MAKWLKKNQIRGVQCPRCWAKPGKPCSDEKGPRERCHSERLKKALVIHGRLPLPPEGRGYMP